MSVLLFESKRKAEKPLISRREASMTAGALVVNLADAEVSDIIATMRFDMTPDDLLAIQSFCVHLEERIKDRKNAHRSGS